MESPANSKAVNNPLRAKSAFIINLSGANNKMDFMEEGSIKTMAKIHQIPFLIVFFLNNYNSSR